MKIHWKSLALAVLLAWIIGYVTPFRQSRVSFDPTTGSTKHEMVYLISSSAPVVGQSEIERWIIRREGSYVPRWERLSTVTHILIGESMTDRVRPRICYLHDGGGDVAFVRRSTDREIAEFVRTMRTGTPDEREQAVDAALWPHVKRRVPRK